MGPDDPEEKADRLVQLYSDAYGEDPDPAQIKQLEDQASRALSTLFGGLGGPMTEKAAFKVPTSVKDFLEYLIAVMKMMPKDS